jgi:hypothetical protein
MLPDFYLAGAGEKKTGRPDAALFVDFSVALVAAVLAACG